MLQALRGDHDLTLLSWTPPDFDAVNRIFGTDLCESDVRIVTPSATVRRMVNALPTPIALLKAGVLRRKLAHMRRRERFDVMLCGNNEFDFGEPGVQYIHYPAEKLPRPSQERRWYHRPPGFVAAYRGLSRWLAGASQRAFRDNVTLVNSAYIARETRALHPVEARIVHPPVVGDFPDLDWDEREVGFVCIGRLSIEKELEKVIEIVSGVRARGHTPRLHLIGDDARSEYAQQIRHIAAETDWIELHIDLPRDALVALVARNRFGIHGMRGEHFGMAVAELQRAGCIPFVPDDAGPAEIVSGDPRLVYASSADAIEKIDHVLNDEALSRSIRGDIAKRKDRYSSERFVSEIRSVVREFGAR
jgi:glycosyltransferase involved in cell wall biosynthesis